jgi:C4-dicarboxylate-specific signal transduction histidine kinase
LAAAVLYTAALAIVAVTWMFVVTQIQHERRDAAAAAVNQNASRVVAYEEYVERTIESADLASAYVASHYAYLLERAGVPGGITKIDDTFLRTKGVREINLLNADGELVATNGDLGPLNGFNSNTFQGDLHSPNTRLRVGPPNRSKQFAGWFIILSRRLNHPDGSFEGSLGVHIRPSEFTKFAHDAPIGDDDVLSVIGLDGITRVRLVGHVESFGQDMRGTPVMRMEEQHPNGTFLARALDGKKRYFSQRLLPRYGLFVTSGISEAAVLRPVRARTRGYILGAIAISITTLASAYLLHMLLRRRIRREAEIISANARLKEAQRVAKLGDWSFDPAGEEIVLSEELSTSYKRLSSHSRMTLDEFGALIGREGVETFRLLLDHVRASGERQEREMTARLPDGTISHRQIVAVPTFDTSGVLVGIHGTDQDVTAGQQLDSLREQVRHLSRMDAMNALTSTLAHELGQPLTAAANYLGAGILMASAKQKLDKDALVVSLNSASSQIQYAGDVIRRVRRLVSNQSSAEQTSLSEVVENAAALLEAANPGLSNVLCMNLKPQSDGVLADPVHLQQVLVNLIRNAYQASRDRDAKITIESSQEDESFVQVRVIDNGPGIPKDSIDVFSPFKTSKREGLGLGLAICQTLIEAMGGRIWVKETGDAGTTICFTLPSADAPEVLGVREIL